jgi:hypothetical protein
MTLHPRAAFLLSEWKNKPRIRGTFARARKDWQEAIARNRWTFSARTAEKCYRKS